jgi:hypothetical protein
MNRGRESPEEVLRRVTEEIVRRAIRLGRRKGRQVRISRTSRGKGWPVEDLDPDAEAGRAALDKLFARPPRHLTISGLGSPEERNAINWRAVNAPLWRRMALMITVAVVLVSKGSPFKNRLLRWMGSHVGRNAEVMQMAWLDHFRPELIFIGDRTVLGAFTRITVHTYEGGGRFRYGLVEIGNDCILGAGTGIGVCRMGDGVRTLPGTIVSPYYPQVEAGAVVGYAPPPKTLPEEPARVRAGTSSGAAG